MSEVNPVSAAVPPGVPAALSNNQPDHRGNTGSARLLAGITSPTPGSSSSRTGRRGLALVRGQLSARDLSVLRLVDDHRFLTTRQIEGWCFTDHATALTGARVSRRVLRRLHQHRVLDHLEQRIGGLRAGSSSLIWQVGPVGDRLQRQDADRPRRRQREPGLKFLDHFLAIADSELALVRAHRDSRLELIEVQLEPDCWRPFTGVGGARLVLQPDLFVVTADPADADFVNRWMVEIDLGTESRARLLAKCARYTAYAATGTEQHDGGAFPLVVWLMPTPARAATFEAALKAASQLNPTMFRVTTHDAFVDLIAGGVV